MKELEQLVRPCIWRLAPYSTARDDFKGGNVDTWLDANESPYNNGTNRYPDPHQRLLKERIAQIKGIEPERMFIGNGSDEAIDLAFRIFCNPGIDNAVAIAPSYGMYAVAADINDVEMREITLNDDFSLPVDRLLAAVDDKTKLIFVCSPNNPTANLFPLSVISRLAEGFDGIVVVDEAYIDFADTPSATTLLSTHPNIIVLQTLSKAWGMAALRLGLAFASPEIMKLYANVKYPYNISALTQATVLKALDTDITNQVAEIKLQRNRVATEIAKSPAVIKVYQSDANFILVKVTDAQGWYDRLLENGVIVRNRSKMPLCEGCLRITIGTPEECTKVINLFNHPDAK